MEGKGERARRENENEEKGRREKEKRASGEENEDRWGLWRDGVVSGGGQGQLWASLIIWAALPKAACGFRPLTLRSPAPAVPHATAPWMSAAIVWFSTGPRRQLRQEEGGQSCWLVLLGLLPLLPGCGPGCQHQRSQVRVARSAGMADLSHSLLSNGPALLGKREGMGSQQPRVRTSSCQSQLLAAIWAGAVPVSQICLPFGKRGENSVLGR